jgi:hypothetical protein
MSSYTWCLIFVLIVYFVAQLQNKSKEKNKEKWLNKIRACQEIQNQCILVDRTSQSNLQKCRENFEVCINK